MEAVSENVDGSVNLIAPPHFTNSDGINNGQRMCEDPVQKTTDVATAEECKEAVQAFVLVEHGNDLANEIVFHEVSYEFKSVPHGCSINLAEKKAYWRSDRVYISRRAEWDYWYSSGTRTTNAPPDNLRRQRLQWAV